MKKQFDIQYRPQIESGEYTLETRDGNRARIICWDREDDANQPLVALVKKRCCEVVIYTKINGEYLGTYGHGYDLFIVTPEEELTDFENAFGRAMMEVPEPEEKEEWYQFLKEKAAELLSLAREQFIKDGYVIEKKAFHDAVEKIDDKHKAEMSIEYSLHCKVENRTRHAVMNWQEFQELAQKFINIGKSDALKDLPRWKKVGLDTGQTTLVIGYTGEEDKLYRNGYVIPLTDLEKLPKEDKK